MALEVFRPGTQGDREDEARRAAAERRALRALESVLGKVTGATDDVRSDDGEDVVDLRDGVVTGDEAMPAWVSVAEAAGRAGVSTSTVRQWYRSGRLATQRREGDRGGFLVPLADVMRLAQEADDDGDVAADSVLDINARYWATETESARKAAQAARLEADAARTEVRRLTADLEDARQQIESARLHLRVTREESANARQAAEERSLAAERAAAEVQHELSFLRSQLGEANAELRDLHHRIAGLEAELEEARRAATFGSVTSTAWVDEATDGYRGPIRRQAAFSDDADADPDAHGPDTYEPDAYGPDTYDTDSGTEPTSAAGSSGAEPAGFASVAEVVAEAPPLASNEPVADLAPFDAGTDDVLPVEPKGRRRR